MSNNDLFGAQARKAFEEARKKNASDLLPSDAVARKRNNSVNVIIPTPSKTNSSNSNTSITPSDRLVKATVASSTPPQILDQQSSSPSTSAQIPSSKNSSQVENNNVTNQQNFGSQTSITLLSNNPSRTTSLQKTQPVEKASSGAIRGEESPIFSTTVPPSKSLLVSTAFSSPSVTPSKKQKEKKRTTDKEKQEALQKASFSIEDWKKEKQELQTLAEKYKNKTQEKETLEKEIGKWMKDTEWKNLTYGDKIIKSCKKRKVPRITYNDVCKMVLTEFGKEKLDTVLQGVDQLIAARNSNNDFLLIRKIQGKNAKRKQTKVVDLGSDDEDDLLND